MDCVCCICKKPCDCDSILCTQCEIDAINDPTHEFWELEEKLSKSSNTH
jgi:hypothetical protein